MTELRQQAVTLDQEGWRLRQQISAASQRQHQLQSKREAVAAVNKERPQWQGLANGTAKPAVQVSSTAGGRATSAGVLSNITNKGELMGSRPLGDAAAAVKRPGSGFGRVVTAKAGPERGGGGGRAPLESKVLRQALLVRRQLRGQEEAPEPAAAELGAE